jgi:hypothetical protein
MPGALLPPMIGAAPDDTTTASRGLGEDMTAFPSDVIYQAHAARRQALLVDAAIERRAAWVASPPSRGTLLIAHACRRLGGFLLVLWDRLLCMDDSTDLQPTLES